MCRKTGGTINSNNKKTEINEKHITVHWLMKKKKRAVSLLCTCGLIEKYITAHNRHQIRVIDDLHSLHFVVHHHQYHRHRGASLLRIHNGSININLMICIDAETKPSRAEHTHTHSIRWELCACFDARTYNLLWNRSHYVYDYWHYWLSALLIVCGHLQANFFIHSSFSLSRSVLFTWIACKRSVWCIQILVKIA